jgi:hypothetical protein
MPDFSIIDEAKLREYLEKRKVFPSVKGLYFRYFSGGVSCDVAFVSDGKRSLLLKQALPALKVAERWECDPARMIVEHRALEVYARLVPGAVPAPVFYDSHNYIMCREAAPEECPMWKTQLLEGLLDFRVAKKAIEALLEVHNRTAGDAGVAEMFKDRQVFYDLRISPYIEFTCVKYPSHKEAAKALIHRLMNERRCLVHGDYSPKNILVSGTQIYILDMEVAHYGHPAFDLAFFTNHFLLKAVKNKAWGGAYLSMLRFMTDIYLKGLSALDSEEMEAASVAALGFLFLARVDGKSPVEYITEEADRELIRRLAGKIILNRFSTFDEVISLVRKNLEC